MKRSDTLDKKEKRCSFSGTYSIEKLSLRNIENKVMLDRHLTVSCQSFTFSSVDGYFYIHVRKKVQFLDRKLLGNQ